MKKSLFIIPLFFLLSLNAFSADSTKLKKTFIDGYVKNVYNGILAGQDQYHVDFIHHRLNITHEFNDRIYAKAGIRNRLFFGNEPIINQFQNTTEIDPGLIDLNFNYYEEPKHFLNTSIDRLYLDFNLMNNVEVRLGRQRLNWGINTIWNPNDIYNALNFVDFDYEERPGVDAIRVQKHFDNKIYSSLDFAASFSRDPKENVYAGRYSFNTKGYDVQVIGGWFKENICTGLGWAGSLKSIGFKGEITGFLPTNNDEQGWLGTAAFDYSLDNGMYMTTGYLFNSFGSSSAPSIFILPNTNQDTRNLMPNKHSVMAGVVYGFSPIASIDLNAVYAIDMNGLILIPSLGFSLKDNLEFLLVNQMVYLEGSFTDQLINSVFLRLKWSY